MIDRYTKFVLTVIAVALCGILIKDGIEAAHADSGITKVTICDQSGNVCMPLYNSFSGQIGVRVFTQ